MVQDTTYNLKLRLQRIEEAIAAVAADNTRAGLGAEASATINLQDEKEVTRQCLRICQDAQSYIESLQKRQPPRPQPSSPLEGVVRNQFEAELRTNQTLNENRESIVQTISYLQQRLVSVVMASDEREPSQVARLLEDINVAKQCLEVCKEASSQIQQRKVHVIGEVIANDDTDQAVITTLADLFDVKKVMANNRTTQLVGSMSDETAQKMSEGRYGSRFGRMSEDSTQSTFAGDGIQGSSAPTLRPVQERGRRSAAAEVERKPSPNEVRKRAAGGEGGVPSADE
jgi:soluble P-type ATPase